MVMKNWVQLGLSRINRAGIGWRYDLKQNESNWAVGSKVMAIYVTGLINWHYVYTQHGLSDEE